MSAPLLFAVVLLSGHPWGSEPGGSEPGGSEPGGSAGEPSLALTLDDALHSVVDHPVIVGRRAGADDRARIDRDLSGLVLGPQAQLLGGLRISEAGETSLDAQLTVSQGFYLSDVGDAERAAATEERAAWDASTRSNALELELEVVDQWMRLWAAEEALRLVERAVMLAIEETTILERSMQAGLRSAHELAEHRVHVEETSLLRVEAEGTRFESRVELARALAHRGRPLSAQGAPPTAELPPTERWPDLVERADDLPSSRAALVAAAAARERARTVGARGAPVLSPTLSAQREGPDQWIGWAGLAVAFGGGASQARALGAASTERAAAEQATTQARLAARAELELALHEVEHGRERLERYDEHVLPAARRAVELEVRAAAVGEGSSLDALRARRRLLLLELERVEAARRRGTAEAHLGLLLTAMSEGEASR